MKSQFWTLIEIWRSLSANLEVGHTVLNQQMPSFARAVCMNMSHPQDKWGRHAQDAWVCSSIRPHCTRSKSPTRKPRSLPQLLRKLPTRLSLVHGTHCFGLAWTYTVTGQHDRHLKNSYPKNGLKLSLGLCLLKKTCQASRQNLSNFWECCVFDSL